MSDESFPRPSEQPLPLDLASAIIEANLILAKHDGIHRLHSDAEALIFMERCAARRVEVDPADAEKVLVRMRRAAATGRWSE